MSTLIIGIDPGDSTGLAAIRDGRLLTAFQGTPANATRMAEILLDKYRATDKITIVVERFTPRHGHVTHQPTAQQYIGVVRNLATKWVVKLVEQGPAEAKAVASNAMLRALDMFPTGKTVGQPDADDAVMAVKHALKYLSASQASVFEQLLAEIPPDAR